MSNFLVGLDLQDVQVDTFSGNASTTAFTLSAAATTNGAAVHISGVRQVPTTDYSIAATTLTFTTAPPTGTNNIAVMYTKTAILNTPADASVTSAKIGNDQVDSQHLAAGSVDLEHMSSQSVDEDNLHISNAGSNGQFLSKQSGDAGGLTWAAAGGGAWNLIGTAVASTSASLDVTGIDSTYDSYAIAVSDLVLSTDNVNIECRFGDSGGFDSGASDYGWTCQTITGAGATSNNSANFNNDHIALTNPGVGGAGNAAGEGFGGMFYLHSPGDGTNRTSMSGTFIYSDNGGALCGGNMTGIMNSVITHDRFQVLAASGNIATGRMTVWGIAHA